MIRLLIWRMAMNFGEHDVKPKEEWRIVFEDFENNLILPVMNLMIMN